MIRSLTLRTCLLSSIVVQYVFRESFYKTNTKRVIRGRSYDHQQQRDDTSRKPRYATDRLEQVDDGPDLPEIHQISEIVLHGNLPPFQIHLMFNIELVGEFDLPTFIPTGYARV